MPDRPLTTTDPDRAWGETVFAGTRVPVAILFERLAAGDSLEDFLRDLPTVTREQAVAVLGARETDAGDRG